VRQPGLTPVQRQFLNGCERLGFADKDMSSVTELFSDAHDAFFERIMTNSCEKPGLSQRKYSQSITKTLN